MASLVPKQEKKLTTDAWALQTWKVALLKNTFTYDHTLHSTYASVSASEVTGSVYVAGGSTLVGKVSSYVDGTTVMLDATDLSWGPGETLSNVLFACCYDTATGLIRALYEFSSNQSCSNATFTLIWHSNGLIRIA
jgi:hypothetical protein